MKLRFGFIVGLMMIGFFMTGCKTTHPVLKADTIIVAEVVRDTIIKTLDPDSAVIRALFECDSLNQVVMTSLAIEQGKKVEPVVKWKDRVLTVTAAIDSQEVFLQWKETHVKEVEVREREVKVQVEVEKELKWWYKALMTFGGAFVLFIMGFGAYKIFR